MRSIAVLPATRVVKGVAATFTHQFVDQDGEPAAPSGTVTVAAVDSEGSTVALGSVSGSGTDPRSVSTSSVVSDVDHITLTWSDDGTEVATDVVEVVGGTIGTVAAIKATDPSINAEPAATVLAKRKTVEDLATRVLGRSPFERFYVERVDGTGTDRLQLAWPDLISVKWARVYSNATSYVELTAAELAAIPADQGGAAVRSDGDIWECGRRNIEIGYRFGLRELPGDLREALHKSVRHAITQFDTGVPTFAASMTTADGFSMGIAGPGNEQWATGDRDVDRVINGYRFRRVQVA